MYAEESESEIHILCLIFGVGECARRKARTKNGFTLDARPAGNQFNKQRDSYHILRLTALNAMN